MGNCHHYCNASDPEPMKSSEKITEIEKELILNLEVKELKKKFPENISLPHIQSESNLLLESKKNYKKKPVYTNGSLHLASEDDVHEDQKSTSSHRTNDLNTLKAIKKPTLNTNSSKQCNDVPKKLMEPKKKKSIVQKTKIEKNKCLKEISPGVIYEGELIDGKRIGKGVQKWVDGTIYEGEWKEDKANGKGKLIHREGDTYEGEWTNDKANGFGVYKNPKGGNYEGQWLNDLQHGKGKEDWPDGSFYDGEFKMGMKHGKGKIVFADGASYEGDFFENNIQGVGDYLWIDKKRFKGEWHQNKMHGKGEFIWENGKKYIGEFQNDRKHGLGKMIHCDGVMFYGFWKSDLKSGKGIKVDKEGKIMELGEWKEGVKVKSYEITEEKGFEVLLNNIKEDKKL